MFLGHVALGLAAKRAAPKVSLGWLVGAASFVDLLWPLLLLLGLEHMEVAPGSTAFTPIAFTHYPISHSLATSIGWGALVGGGYWFWRKDGVGALWMGLLVPSHWLLDLLTHAPDLPLWPGGPRHGLGLWNSVPATVLLELAVFAGALWSYTRHTEARSRTGYWVLGTWAAALTVIFLANGFGPPPPGERAVGIVGLSGVLLVLWAGWADANRRMRPRVIL